MTGSSGNSTYIKQISRNVVPCEHRHLCASTTLCEHKTQVEQLNGGFEILDLALVVGKYVVTNGK